MQPEIILEKYIIMYPVKEELLKEPLQTAIEAARLGGEIIMKHLGGLRPGDIMTKQAFDFVTMVDRLSEEAIMQIISERHPGHLFLSEEGLKQEAGAGYRWIIDPLDGTTNFIHSYPMFSVSIGLEYRGEIVLGVVLDPLKDELFHAVKGMGAFLNNLAIRVSDTTELSQALVATGFPFRRKDLTENYMQLFKAIFHDVSDLRRAGSAALDLAYVACGRLDGFFELALSSWDVAAGSLLIREAGGAITDFGGGSYLSTGNIVAGTTAVHEALLRHVRNVFSGFIDS